MQIKKDSLSRSYAAIIHSADDDISLERNKELLKKECSRAKPKSEVVRELIKRTLKERRQKVLNGERPEVIMNEYPHLRKTNYVSQLFVNSLVAVIFVGFRINLYLIIG